jgi:quinol monooxygenase YgiN
MIVEYIRYSVDSGRAETFEHAYRRAAEALEASEHSERYEVSRCTEDPTQHVVRIERDSEEGHVSGFRQSAEFRRFLEAVGPFVHDAAGTCAPAEERTVDPLSLPRLDSDPGAGSRLSGATSSESSACQVCRSSPFRSPRFPTATGL